MEGYERSRMALAKSFFENKVRSDAAKVIQRHWREHRLMRMRKQQTEGYQVGGNPAGGVTKQPQRDSRLARSLARRCGPPT